MYYDDYSFVYILTFNCITMSALYMVRYIFDGIYQMRIGKDKMLSQSQLEKFQNIY